MTRVKEADFIARHAFQRLSTTEVRQDPALARAGVDTADVDNNGEIAGAPELGSLYRKLLALDPTATPSTGVDLDSAAVKPVYSALGVRFSQKTGVEAPLGSRTLAAVPELSAFASGVAVISRKDGVRQLGVGSVQEALNVVAAAAEQRTGQPSLFRVNLGQNNANRGLFGPGTEGAIKHFQQVSGLLQSGRIDNATLAALDRALADARAPAPTPTPTPTPTPPPAPTPSTPVAAPRFHAAPFTEVLAGRQVLRPGERGAHVTALQEALMDMGFPMMSLKNDVGVSGIDGAWGGQTSTALTNFQVHARKKFPDVRPNGVLDKATMKALLALAPAPGTKAWESGNPQHGPAPFWNGEASKQLRIVVVKDEHRTFMYGPSGSLEGIFPNAHGVAGNATQSGLKRVRTRLDESSAKITGQQLWQDPRAFGKRIVDLSWASGTSSGEELHGTYDYRNMGKDVSHGCVRHYNEDIITIFNNLQVGNLVAIVDSVDDPMLRRP